MNVTVTKSPDGMLYMTKDGHGELFSGDVKVDAKPQSFGDNTVELILVPSKYEGDDASTVLRFSYVDYLNTANREIPGDGVRQFFDRIVPGRFDFGPYVVVVDE